MYIITGHSQGLQNDAIVLQKKMAPLNLPAQIIRPDVESRNPLKRHPLIGKKLHRIMSGKKQSANFHLERIHAAWTSLAQLNIWIPNQEQLLETTIKGIPLMDYVFCKTKDAQAIFSNYHPHCIYTGFSSIDRFDATYKKNYRNFLHLMGTSKFKGSRTLLKTWSQHPEWPVLQVVCTPRPWNDIKWMDEFKATNIQLNYGPITDQKLIELQNTCGIHLCPSETEGFGHYIIEALSTKAVVLTTNAPPMNAHVDRTHGYLADFCRTTQFGLGTRYFVEAMSLEAQIEAILQAEQMDLAEMGNLARERYLKIDSDFMVNLSQHCHTIGIWAEPALETSRKAVHF